MLGDQNPSSGNVKTKQKLAARVKLAKLHSEKPSPRVINSPYQQSKNWARAQIHRLEFWVNPKIM